MDFLQAALIFLILLLSIFLAITGFQVFFILRDLKKALDKFNKVLQSGEHIVEDRERPVATISKLLKPKAKRFYKKVL